MTIYLEDIDEGWRFMTARRTIVDADVINFAGLSGDFNPLHIDDTYAKTTAFGQRVAHGMLIASIVTGLRSPFDDIAVLAFLETQRKFVGPTFIGSTIRAEFTFSTVRRSKSNPSQGVVHIDVNVLDQDDNVVQTGVDICLIAARPVEEA